MRRIILLFLLLAFADAAQAQQIPGEIPLSIAAQGHGVATTTAATTIIAAPASGRLRITAVQCYRNDAGTAAVVITLNDTAGTVIVIPNNGGGGGSNVNYQRVPLVIPATTAFTFTAGTAISQIHCDAQGYVGS